MNFPRVLCDDVGKWEELHGNQAACQVIFDSGDNLVP